MWNINSSTFSSKQWIPTKLHLLRWETMNTTTLQIWHLGNSKRSGKPGKRCLLTYEIQVASLTKVRLCQQDQNEHEDESFGSFCTLRVTNEYLSQAFLVFRNYHQLMLAKAKPWVFPKTPWVFQKKKFIQKNERFFQNFLFFPRFYVVYLENLSLGKIFPKEAIKFSTSWQKNKF